MNPGKVIFWWFLLFKTLGMCLSMIGKAFSKDNNEMYRPTVVNAGVVKTGQNGDVLIYSLWL